MLRIGLALGLISGALGLTSCTVKGEEVASTFFDPTANASGTPPTTGSGDTESDTEEPQTSGASGGTADSGATSNVTTTNTTMPSESSGGSVDEQPADGMYSECASGVDCIGLTTCVLVADAEGGGFCSNTGCAVPAVDCFPNPGVSSSATPDCIDNGAGALVCALTCAGGQTCPGGMQCLAVGVTMACA